MTIVRVLLAILIVSITFAFLPAMSRAEPTTASSTAPATSQAQNRTALPSPESIFAPQSASMEDSIAQLVQKRDGVPQETMPWLDLQIDSRIFARWLLKQAAGGSEINNHQVAAYLHAVSMLGVVSVVDDYASKQSSGPSPVQSVGLTRLHQLTYQLKAGQSVAGVDAACAEAAQAIQIAVTPMQGGERLPALVPMRPDVSASSTEPVEDSGTAGGVKSADDLAAVARQATVSPQLRQQLIALATIAEQAQSDATNDSERQSLRGGLKDALDITAGLQTNTAVTTQERGQIELQLGDALALFGDPRLREAGRARLESLDRYRNLLDRIALMQIPPELGQGLSPALTWAQEHSDQGDQVFSALEKFVKLHQSHEALPPPTEQFAAMRPNDPLRRAYEETNKQFTKVHDEFLSAAANIGSTSGVIAPKDPDGRWDQRDNSSAVNAIQTMSDRITEMSRLEDLLEVLLSMPRTIQTLNAFKPRPTGGIERRVNAMLFTIDSQATAPAREEATAQLNNLRRLATLAEGLETQGGAAVSPAVVQAYADNQIAGVETKWRSMVIELASAFSTNQRIDSDKLRRLAGVHGLFDALGPAQTFETAFAKPEGLAKWADWTLTPQEVNTLMQPYQQALSQAFDGVISDNPDALVAFARLQPRYEALMALFTQTAGFSSVCAELPDGTLGSLARLATPYDKAPFAHQRVVSFIAALAGPSNDDPAATESAIVAISEKIAR